MPFYDPSNTAERAYGTVRVGGDVDFGNTPSTISVAMNATLVGLPGWYTIFEAVGDIFGTGAFLRDGNYINPNTDVSAWLNVTIPPGFSILSGPAVDATGKKIKIQIG